MEAKNSSARPKEKRAYGKAPLELDLPQSLEAVGKIAQEGRSLPESKLALVLGNTITSSAFSRKLRALAAYGLLSEQAGQFVLSELALAITLPRSPQAQIEAKKQAFLNIDQFAFLFNQHKGKLLPADEFLRNILEQESDIPREASGAWVQQFKSGANAAGLFHSRGDGKVQIAESPMLTSEPQGAAPVGEPSEKRATARTEADGQPITSIRSTEPQSVIAAMASGHYSRIDLTGGRRAEISIPDGLSPRDAEKIKKALQGVAVIIDSMVSDDGS